MDSIDRAILNIIQTSFPIDRHPYRRIGNEAGLTEEEAWNRVNNLRENGIIRRIGGIFDSRRLGYISTLCAAKVPEEKVPVLAKLSQQTTEITHNYLRKHAYNMWFTIIAASPARLEEILAQVKAALGSDHVYSLPAIKMFKIGVHFDLEGDGTNEEIKNVMTKVNIQGCDTKTDSTHYLVSENDKDLIRKLQDNLSPSLSPFEDIAAELDRDVDKVLSDTYRLIDNRIMRRLSAILYHDKAGFTSNAMGVWIVPKEMVNEVGTMMAEFKEVSHCYERPALPDWPYNIFTMIHGQSDEVCEQIMNSISQATGIKDYSMLFSQRELKKSSMKYFMESIRM